MGLPAAVLFNPAGKLAAQTMAHPESVCAKRRWRGQRGQDMLR
jgi:hypothetical protein